MKTCPASTDVNLPFSGEHWLYPSGSWHTWDAQGTLPTPCHGWEDAFNSFSLAWVSWVGSAPSSRSLGIVFNSLLWQFDGSHSWPSSWVVGKLDSLSLIIYPPGNQHIPSHRYFWRFVPFPKVEYVSSLKGRVFIHPFGASPLFFPIDGCNWLQEMDMDRLPNISTSNTTLSGFAMGAMDRKTYTWPKRRNTMVD